MRSGAFAKSATPKKKIKKIESSPQAVGGGGATDEDTWCQCWRFSLTDMGVFESPDIICAITTHQRNITKTLKAGDDKFL